MPFTRQGTNDRYVVLTHGALTIKFDTLFGGAPLIWEQSGVPLISSHPGEGFQPTIEEGQDLTQATANGETTYPIARTIDPLPVLEYRNYYIRESVQANFPTGSTYYKVTGFYPDFWLSHEVADDAIPPLASGQAQNGWIVRYLFPNNQLPWPYNTLPYPDRGGAPVFFQSTSLQSSGIFLEANQMLSPASIPWNARLREIPDGRVAFRCRVSLSQASANAWAGILLCKSIPTTGTLNMDDAFNAVGYSLNVNRDGALELRRPDHQTPVWTLTNSAHIQLVQQTVNSVQGCLLEVRTNNVLTDTLEFWVQETKVGEKVLGSGERLKGPNFGLIAYTDYNPSTLQYVKFSDREVFNVGTEVESTFTPLPDGSVEHDLFVKSHQDVATPRKFYRVNVVSFMPPSIGMNYIWTYSMWGHYLFFPSYLDSVVSKIAGAQPNPAMYLWGGYGDGSKGLWCKPVSVEFSSDYQNPNSTPGTYAPHAFSDTELNPANPLHKTLVHLNALPIYTSGLPWSLTWVRIKSKWIGTLAQI